MTEDTTAKPLTLDEVDEIWEVRHRLLSLTGYAGNESRIDKLRNRLKATLADGADALDYTPETDSKLRWLLDTIVPSSERALQVLNKLAGADE